LKTDNKSANSVANGPIEFDLDNGLHVILKQDHFAPVVAFQMWVKVGSSDEKRDEAGLAHVLEHMLFKGTERRGVGEIAHDIEGAGGDVNAWTSHDETVFHLALPAREFNEGLDILADAIRNTALDPEELANELEVICEEIKRGKDSPGRVLSEEIFKTSYKKHPYRYPVIGSEESVRSFTREKVYAFYKHWYAPQNMTLVLAGDFDETQARAEIDKQLGDFTSDSEILHQHTEEPERTAPIASNIDDNVHQCHMSFSFPACSIMGEELPALDVISVLLGQGESSRLIQHLQREKSLINEAFAYPYAARSAGLFLLDIATPKENLEESLKQVSFEVFRFTHDKISQNELEKAKTIVENEAVYQIQTMQGKARLYGHGYSMTGDSNFQRGYIKKIKSLTVEDVINTARKVFDIDKFNVVVSGPKEFDNRPDDKRLIECVKEGAELGKSFVNEALKPDNNGVLRQVLPNGLRLIVKENHSVPLVSMQAGFLAGLRFEDEQNNGVNNLISRMLTLGTAKMSARELAEAVESMAGTLSGFAGRNTLGLKSTSISRNFESAMNIFADCLLAPQFDKAELEKEKRLVSEEIKARDEQPGRVAFDLFHKTLYKNHPFKMDSMGTFETLENLGCDELKQYYKKMLDPKRLTISVVGDVKAEDVIKIVNKRFAEMKSSENNLKDPIPEVKANEIRTEKTVLDRQQTHLVLGFHGLRFKDEERYALDVLNAALSGQGGRLFMELRDKQSLAYSVGSFHLESLDPGYFALYIGTSPEKAKDAVDGMIRELSRVLDEGLEEAEIAHARRYLSGSHAIGLQTNSSQAGHMLLNELYDLGYDAHYGFRDKILAVTSEDVKNVAKKLIDLESYTLVEVGPE